MSKIKYSEIVENLTKLSIDVDSNINNGETFTNINTIRDSKINDLTFFSNIKYKNDLKNVSAKACLIKKEFVNLLPKNCQPIVVKDPYLALASLSTLFSQKINISNGVISKNCSIHDKAKLGKNIQIDNFTFIDEEVFIGNNVIINSNCKIGPNVTIEDNCIIHDNVTISNSIIKKNCEIQSGARLGGSGFGFEEKSKIKIFHHGNVIINEFSNIGSNTTIDRAVFDSTEIGQYSQIDNLVQIAHNVSIGEHAIIAAQVGIAGSTKIGKNVKIGGQVGIAGHLIIGDNVTIAGKSGVTKNISNNKIIAGFPAKDIKLWKREIIKFNKLK